MKPIEFCNQVSESFKRLCEAANIEYSSFERTTNPHHKKAVNELWVNEERERRRSFVLIHATTEPTFEEWLFIQGKA